MAFSGGARKAWVTADDARPIMEKLGIAFANNNCLGSLFAPKNWVRVTDELGYHHSAIENSHANPQHKWTLAVFAHQVRNASRILETP